MLAYLNQRKEQEKSINTEVSTLKDRIATTRNMDVTEANNQLFEQEKSLNNHKG